MFERIQSYFAFIDSSLERALLVAVVAIVVIAFIQLVVLRLVRYLVRRTSWELDDQVVDHLSVPVLQTVVLTAILFIVADLSTSPRFTKIVIAADETLIILIWTRALLKVGRLVISRLSNLRGRFQWIVPKTVPLMNFALMFAVAGGAVYWILLVWNINVTHWVASAGVMGIALGFAAKDTLANFFAGVFILADTPYQPGDFVVLEDGIRGQVTDIGIRSTRLLTRDDVEIILPNAIIANSKIVNESQGPYLKMRVRVKVAVAYGSDVDLVESVLMKCTEDVEHLVAWPSPRVRFREFGDSGLLFELLAWIDEPVVRGRVLHQLNRRVYKALGEADIEIPYAKQDLYIKEFPGQKSATPEIPASDHS